jgi:hypothetical protein
VKISQDSPQGVFSTPFGLKIKLSSTAWERMKRAHFHISKRSGEENHAIPNQKILLLDFVREP